MARVLTVAAAQLGPIAKSENRASVVTRMLDLMNAAKRKRCEQVVFPELALTTFFPLSLIHISEPTRRYANWCSVVGL